MEKKNSRNAAYEIYAMLWVTRQCEERISNVLSNSCGIKHEFIRGGLHLTVYYGREPLPGLTLKRQDVKIVADTIETRFMPMTPGGESPHSGRDPRQYAVGIRLTRRNQAIGQIQELRKNMYQLETREMIGNGKATTAWKSRFGSRYFQPHITLLHPNSNIDPDLTKLGKVFRSEIDVIEFGRLEIREHQGR